jgi:hypothetical protein
MLNWTDTCSCTRLMLCSCQAIGLQDTATHCLLLSSAAD